MTEATETTADTGKEAESAEEAGKKYSFQIESLDSENMPERFLKAFAAILRHSNYVGALEMYSRMDMKCGRCAGMCQVYRASQDPKDDPCRRTGLLLNIYKRYFTPHGALRSEYDDMDILDSEIDELIESMYRCTMCRRCHLECPAGIDHALITHLGRYILSEMRVIPRTLRVAVRNQLEGKTKNILNMQPAALMDTIEFLEEELEETTGRKIKIPVGKRDVDYVFFPPVTDFMSEAETLMGHAAAMHAMGLGDRWTIGDRVYDVKNYGYYYSDWIFERLTRELVGETKRLNGRNILIGECGHATRAARLGVPAWGGSNPPNVVSSIELLYEGVKTGKIKLDPNAVAEKVTYHDPCNIGRNCGIVAQPRFILKRFVKNFVEMRPNGRYNFCCGAGPASIDEIHDYRMTTGGKMKAEQLRKTGAAIVVAPCANCKKQIGELIEHHKLPMERKGLHDLVLKAIVWD
ncbi:MAG: (Fe-S)-binding protein [bacterium]